MIRKSTNYKSQDFAHRDIEGVKKFPTDEGPLQRKFLCQLYFFVDIKDNSNIVHIDVALLITNTSGGREQPGFIFDKTAARN